MSALLTLFDGDTFSPRRLFLSTTIGAIYAYDDFSYLNQKSDGSTPVTALEQPVGLVVDQRWGGAVGATELVANGTFTTGTTGWTVGSGANAATLSVSGGSLRATSATTFGRFYPDAPLTTVAGSSYLISFDIVAFASGNSAFRVGTFLGGADVLPTRSVTGVGRKSFIIRAASASTYLWFENGATSGGYQEIDNISVRELPGLHAYQSTDAARLQLKGTPRYVNLDGTDDRLVTATGGGSTTGFLLVTGINVGGAGTARTIFSDRGTNTGYKVEVDAANNLVFTAGNGASFVSCTGPAITAGTSYVIACWHDGTNLNIKVGSGAVTSQAFATASAGTAAISIGRDNGAATGFYNGRLYPTVYIKDSTAPVGAIASTMAWVAGKGGIAL